MMSQDYQLRMGLGKDGIGIITLMELKCQESYIELRYKLKKEDRRYLKNKKRGNAVDSDWSGDGISIPIPHIFGAFIKSLHVLHLRLPFIADYENNELT